MKTYVFSLHRQRQFSIWHSRNWEFGLGSSNFVTDERKHVPIRASVAFEGLKYICYLKVEQDFFGAIQIQLEKGV